MNLNLNIMCLLELSWNTAERSVSHWHDKCLFGTLQNSIPKLAGQNPECVSKEAIYHGILTITSSKYKAFEKLLLKPNEMILKSHFGIKCHS